MTAEQVYEKIGELVAHIKHHESRIDTDDMTSRKNKVLAQFYRAELENFLMGHF